MGLVKSVCGIVFKSVCQGLLSDWNIFFFLTYKSLREHDWLNYLGKWGKNWVRVFKPGGIDEDGLQGCVGLVESVRER